MARALDTTKAPELLQQAILALGQPDVELDQPRIMLKQAVATMECCFNSKRYSFGWNIPIGNKNPMHGKGLLSNFQA